MRPQAAPQTLGLEWRGLHMLAPEFNPSQIHAIPACICVTAPFFFFSSPCAQGRRGRRRGDQQHPCIRTGAGHLQASSPRQGAVSWNQRRPGEDMRSSRHPESHSPRHSGRYFSARWLLFQKKWAGGEMDGQTGTGQV